MTLEKQPLQAWNRARNLLCVRLDALGDVLMTAPALRALKEAVAGRYVTLLTSPSGGVASAYLDDVDQTIIFEAPWMKASSERKSSDHDAEMVLLLRRLRFDAAVIFTVYSQNPLPAAYMCYLADIPLRAAFSRENPYQLLTDWIPETEPQLNIRHEVRRQLDLATLLGAKSHDEKMRLKPTGDALKTVNIHCDAVGLDRRRLWIVIHPGASASSRRYPAEKFAKAARLLVEGMNAQIVFTGTTEEKGLLERMRSERPSYDVFDFMGLLDFAELVALISETPLLISNNTAPVHIAASVGTPVVDLYAWTNPQHTPWMVEHRLLNKEVPCKYCYKSICPYGHQNCLALVTPEEVVAAAADLLKENPLCIR